MLNKVLSVDFDGVIHSYTSGWKGETVIPDPPVQYAFDWLTDMVNHFEVCIFSSRSRSAEGRQAMRDWFRRHGLPESVLAKISFPNAKPPAFVTLDDRAIRFNGSFPTVRDIDSFKPWYQ